MLECNIDDMNNEFFEHTMDKLFKEGALDVFLTGIIMKKSRPAVKLSVLVKSGDISRLSNIIFSETSTIGIRRYQVERDILKREIVKIPCRFGIIGVKVSYLDGEIVNYAPEYEDVRSAAVQSGTSIKEVYNESIKEFMNVKKI